MASSKKRELSSETPSAKRQKKTEGKKGKTTPSSAPAASPPPKAADKSEAPKSSSGPAKSILKPEEDIFPRGGGSVLTPQELKQIHIQAKQDVLFEQGLAAKKSAIADLDEPVGEKKSKKDKKDKKSKKNGKTVVDKSIGAETIKPEGLSYKRLAEGSIVLGQITEITRQDIRLAIPNNLSGFVPIAAVSDQLTKKIEKALASDDEADSDSEDEDESDLVLSLDRYFRLGQTLRAFVSGTEDGDGVLTSKTKRHIELSLEPSLANTGIRKSDLHPGCMVQAAVVSVEDHGLVMDLGLEDSTTPAFLPTSELEDGISIDSIHSGAVILCQVTETGKKGANVKLTANHTRSGDVSKIDYVTSAPSIKSILPGTPVDLLITDTFARGVVGKIMGMLDATADFIHSGGPTDSDIENKYSIGERVKARVICTFPNLDPSRVGVSLLPHMLDLKKVESPFKNSEIVEGKVAFEPTKNGLYLKHKGQTVPSYVHVSRVHDKKISALKTEANYKAGTTHRSRVIGFNPVDGLVVAAMDEKTLSQPFLTIHDVNNGQVVEGKIEKLLHKEDKVSGILVTLADGITGFVPEAHFSDVELTQPEKRFRVGQNVRAIVLAVNAFRRRIRLSLKKSLVNSDAKKFLSLNKISPGDQSPGTLIKVFQTGALVKFFGPVRGFLPISEMSESYVADARQFFRTGQVVSVHVLKVDNANRQLILSCRDPTSFGHNKQDAFEKIELGDVVSGTITALEAEGVVLQVGEAAVKGLLKVSQLSDRSEKRNNQILKKLRVGQTLSELLVIMKNGRRNVVTLSQKQSLIVAAKEKKLPFTPEDVTEGETYPGYVRGISSDGVFVQFGASVVGLVHRTKLPEGATNEGSTFGFSVGQSVSPRVVVVGSQGRIQLSLRPEEKKEEKPEAKTETPAELVSNPVDKTIKVSSDFELGKVVKALITSVKETQLNVKLADNVQGRVDVSEAFASLSEMKSAKSPLGKFTKGEFVEARIIGIHDARSHTFLPISHRSGKVPVFELSIRSAKSKASEISDLSQLEVGRSYPAYVNNFGPSNIWVNLSAGVRGSIDLFHLSDQLDRLQNPKEHFPLGSALEAEVIAVDPKTNRLDLAAYTPPTDAAENVKVGSLLIGRVTKVQPRALMVQLSGKLSGIVPLTELSDDYDSASTEKYDKNDFVRVAVASVNEDRTRIVLSTRPSQVLSSKLEIKDSYIPSAGSVEVGQIIRGFVTRIGSKGVSVSVGPSTTAFVQTAELSDKFLKEDDVKKKFAAGQLVKGRVTVVDAEADRLQMSLKPSVLSSNYKAPVVFEALQVGQVYAAKIRKVENYGVFVVIENSRNVSGLCHKSMLADDAVENISELYEEGDRVKAKVVSVDKERRRVGFGLKASLFDGEEMEVDEEEEADEDVEMDSGSEVEGDEEEGGVRLGADSDEEVEEDESEEEAVSEDESGSDEGGSGDDSDSDDSSDGSDAEAIPFDWTGENVSASLAAPAPKKQAEKGKAAADSADKTATIDASGPQSVADFERLLLSEPNSSPLWIQYMAFFAQLGEIDQARAVAKRALTTIQQRETDERGNVWVALLNLENSFGTAGSLKDAFAEAVQYNDSAEMHEKLASILIESGKTAEARALFKAMTKLRALSAAPDFWLNYASFLMANAGDADGARALLKRATQSVPDRLHRQLTLKFAALEFKSAGGDPERGRTVFEGLVAAFPNRGDVWDAWVELEKRGDGAGSDADRLAQVGRVRDLLVRMSGLKMKKVRAKKFFERWIKWEQSLPARKGQQKEVEKVKLRAKEYVERMQAERAEREAEEDDSE